MVLTMAPMAFAADEETADSSSGSTGADIVDSSSTSGDSDSGETATCVAQIGNTDYATLQAAVDAANNGDTVQLLTDVLQNSEVCINKDITLNLNGKKIYNTEDIWANGVVALVNVKNNANVTITGNGVITAKENDCYAINLVSGTLTIEDGNIVGNVSAVQVQAGHLYIKGGTFSLLQKCENKSTYLINMIDEAYQDGSARATITGGKFVDYEPSQSTSEHPNANFVPTGYNVTRDGDSYVVTVKSDNAAEIGDIQYATLADAVAAATAGQTVTLLKNTAEDITIEAGKDIVLDLNGKTLTNKTEHTIYNQGTLTIVDGVGNGVVDNQSHGKAALYNKGTVNVNGGTFDRSQEKGTNKDESGENSWYTIKNVGNMTISDGATVQTAANNADRGKFSSLVSNGYFNNADYTNNKGLEQPSLTIDGGTFRGGLNTIKNDDRAQLTINRGTFSNYYQAVVQNHNIAEIKGGTFTVASDANAETYGIYNCGCAPEIDLGTLTVSGGTFTGATYAVADVSTEHATVKISNGQFAGTKAAIIKGSKSNATITITGGDFTSDPSAYLAAGKYVIKSNKAGYTHTVTDTKPAEAPVFVQENTEAKLDNSVSADIKNQMTTEVLGKTEVNGVADAVKEDALLKNAGIDVKADAVNVNKVDVEVKVDVQLTDGNLSDGAKNKTLTFKAEPVATVTVTKANGTPEVKNGVKVPNSFLNGKAITVKLPLPANFNPEQIKHISSDGSVEYFLKTAKRGAKTFEIIDGCAVFTITKFSTFELSGTATYVEPSSGGSSSGKTTYKVTTSAVNNGGVNASPSSAEKGATITITLSPDKGYKLDKLTVTDGSGKTVSTVKKSDTVYTFTMPASAVNVGVSYVKADATPSETKFNDVSANDWFASAVDYVTGKHMMNGTAANTFSPKANTTRGMVVTVLYRLENEPSTSAASFTDVASGAYYANAVAWANANGIVSGYGSDKFGPNDKVTREQLAVILYRYAQYKKYDVSGANSLDGYTDAQSVSSYAVPALQWANAAGVVTGKSGSKLDPKGNATRAEVAAMLMRFCENVK